MSIGKVVSTKDRVRKYTAESALLHTPANASVYYITTTSGLFTEIGFWVYENDAWKKV